MAFNYPEWTGVQNPVSTQVQTVEPIIVAQNFTTDGFSAPVVVPLTQSYNLYLIGLFDGATVEFQFSIDGVEFISAPSPAAPIQFLESTVQYFDKLDGGVMYRISMFGAGAGTDIDVELR